MSKIEFIESAPGAAAAGTWPLWPGQSLSLQPRRGGTLRVAAGTVWATGGAAPAGAADDRGDHLLVAGEAMRVRPGERLVLEALGSGPAARFDWDPVSPWNARRGSASAVLWRIALVVPASALTLAIWFAAASESSRHRADVAPPVSAAAVQHDAQRPPGFAPR